MLFLTSKLEAVNTLLSVIGESPIDQLGAGLVQAEVAESLIDEISRSVQTEGWSFNTDMEKELAPDVDGFIQLMPNVLRVDSAGRHRYVHNVVQRAEFLYDRKKQTYIFTEPLVCNVVMGLDFDELPEHARRYITVKAARIFQKRMIGSTELEQLNAEDEQRAWFAFLQLESLNDDSSMLDNNEFLLELNRYI